MDGQSFQIIPGRNSGKTFIQVSEAHENELGIITTKRGFLEVNAAKAGAILEGLQSGELKAQFGKPNNQTGLLEVSVYAASAEVTA